VTTSKQYLLENHAVVLPAIYRLPIPTLLANNQKL
jgi:hypothetical protein